MEQNFIENELIIVTKATLDKFLKEENPADLIALYIFFYYTAKWQKTNIVKATSGYVKSGLSWGIDRLNKAQNKLIELGLIEKVTRKSKGKIVGWYIKVNYIFSQNTTEIVQNTQKPQVDETTSGKQETNALSTNNINALSTNNKYKQLGDKTLPVERGNTPLKRIMSIYGTLFNHEYGIADNQPYGKKAGIFTSLLKEYTELQLAYLLIVFFTWNGMSCQDKREREFLVNNTHSVGLFKAGLNKYLAWTKNVSGYDKEFDSSDELLPIIGKYIISLTNN